MNTGWPESMRSFNSVGSMRDMRSERRKARRWSIRQTRNPIKSAAKIAPKKCAAQDSALGLRLRTSPKKRPPRVTAEQPQQRAGAIAHQEFSVTHANLSCDGSSHGAETGNKLRQQQCSRSALGKVHLRFCERTPCFRGSAGTSAAPQRRHSVCRRYTRWYPQ